MAAGSDFERNAHLVILFEVFEKAANNAGRDPQDVRIRTTGII